MALNKENQNKGRGFKVYNPFAALKRRKNALAALELQMESGVRDNGESLSEKDLERIKAHMAVLQERIKAGEDFQQMMKDKDYRTSRKYKKSQKIMAPRKEKVAKEVKVGEKVEVNRYENEVIDCYRLEARHGNKKKKKEARRQGSKQALTGDNKVQKGWNKVHFLTIASGPGVLEHLKSGKHPNCRFDGKERKVFMTRNTKDNPYPVKKG